MLAEQGGELEREIEEEIVFGKKGMKRYLCAFMEGERPSLTIR